MEDPSKIGENRANFVMTPKGSKFAKGCQIGRMKKKGFTLTDLNKLVRKFEEANGTPILKHYTEQLFKDNTLLGKYIDKNVPTKNEFSGPGGEPLAFIIEKTYQGEDDKSNQDKTNT